MSTWQSTGAPPAGLALTAARLLGAHGHRNGVRRRNVRNLDTYVARISEGSRPTAGEEQLGPSDIGEERILLGLRRTAGVELGATERTWLSTAEAQRLLASGVVTVDGTRLVVRQPLLTDSVVTSVLSLSPGDC